MTVPAHGGKGQLMVPEGRFMAENDKSCLLSPQSSALITYLLTLDP
jgi:hypothetical protein